MYASSQDMSQKAAAAAAAAASAFTPIQSMIPPSAAAAAARSVYFPYESFGFASGKSSNGSGMDVKNVTGHTAFPNQLIALHQIRNYASMPGSSLSVGGGGGANGSTGDSKDVKHAHGQMRVS